MYSTIKLSSIKIYYKGKFIKIRHHPYYIALLNHDKNLYEQCIANSGIVQRLKPTATWEGIQNLINIIKTNGFKLYNGRFDLFKNESYGHKHKHTSNTLYSRHGRHRLCILLYLYGKNLTFKLKQYRHYKNNYKIIQLINLI